MYSYSGYTYDKAGNKTSDATGKDLTALFGVPADDRLLITSYTYDFMGRAVSVIQEDGTKTQYEYDLDGNMVTQGKYSSEYIKTTTEFTYNQLGKVTNKTLYVKEGSIYGNNIEETSLTGLETAYTYDKNGNLLTVTTPDGKTIAYTYDEMDRVLTTSVPAINEYGITVNAVTQTTYDFEGKVFTVTAPNGKVTQNTYDKRGFLTESEESAVVDSVTEEHITSYGYDLAGRLITEVSPENYDDTYELSDMNRVEYVYDAVDRLKVKRSIYRLSVSDPWVTEVAAAYQYDLNGNVIKTIDGESFASQAGTDDEIIAAAYGTQYTYNLANMVLTELDPVSRDNGLSYAVKYGYDGALRKISETHAAGAVYSYYYDDAGHLVKSTARKSATDTEVTISTAAYDYNGNILTSTDGNGNTTTYEYNDFGQVSKVTYPGDATIPENTIVYQYDVMGNLMFSCDGSDAEDLYTVDLQNLILSHTRQDEYGLNSITTSVKYDKSGNKRFETDGNGNTTEYVYDGFGRLTETTILVTGAAGSSTEHTTGYAYDLNGNVVSRTDWLGNTYSMAYDPINRLIEKSDPYTVINRYEYNKNSAQSVMHSVTQTGIFVDTAYSYDKDGRLMTTTDPENNTTSQLYDSDGNVTTRIDGNANVTHYSYDCLNRLAAVTNARDEVTRYTYDACDNMVTQTDGRGNTTTYVYNARNKLIRTMDQGGEGVSAKTESYTYDLFGNMLAKLDRNGVTTAYTYDIHSRMLSQEAGEESIRYTYDGNGNKLAMIDSTGVTARSYDELNRVVTKSLSYLGTTSFEYDILDAELGVGTGEYAERTTDPRGNVTIKIYDKTGKLIKVKDSETADPTEYTYNAAGRKTGVAYPNGASETYTYYDNGLLETLYNYDSGSVIPKDSYSYTYDDAGNQITKSEMENGVTRGVTQYAYDALNRLRLITDPDDNTTVYTYDAAGNRLMEMVTEEGVTEKTIYTYNEQNRLMQTESVVETATKTTEYKYDNNGNLIYRCMEITKEIDPYDPPTTHFGMFIPGQGATEYAPEEIIDSIGYYSYDAFNRLIKETSGNGTVENKYNGEGLRVEKISNGVLTRYVYVGYEIILEADDRGRQKARNLYGTGLISREAGIQLAYYFYNGHGDVVRLSNAEDTVLATYYYDAWGEVVEENELTSVDNPYRYAGYVYDEETGLYYLNARFYDPSTARFMSADTYPGDQSDPLSLNLYVYCSNNPVIYVDPTGHILTSWDIEHCTDDEILAIINATAAWNQAYASGDTAGMAAAHAAAVAARSNSGNMDEDEEVNSSGYVVKKNTNDVTTDDDITEEITIEKIPVYTMNPIIEVSSNGKIRQNAINHAEDALSDIYYEGHYDYPENWSVFQYSWLYFYKLEYLQALSDLNNVAAFFSAVDFATLLYENYSEFAANSGSSVWAIVAGTAKTIWEKQWEITPGIGDLPEVLGINGNLTKKISMAFEKYTYMSNSIYKYLTWNSLFYSPKDYFINAVSDLIVSSEEKKMNFYINDYENIIFNQSYLSYLGRVVTININYDQSLKTMNYFLDEIESYYK